MNERCTEMSGKGTGMNGMEWNVQGATEGQRKGGTYF